MNCKECGKQIPDDSKFCDECGAKITSDNVETPVAAIASGNLSDDTSEKTKSKTTPTAKKKGSWIDWLFWWEIGDAELKREVENYSTLKPFNSVRGWSVICLLFSAALTFLFIIFGSWTTAAYFDIAMFLFLAFFIYRGHRWAMIGAMILWTLEKCYSVYQSVSGSSNAYLVIVVVLWWAAYMHAFWFAYRVEVERRKMNPKVPDLQKTSLSN